MQAEIVGDNDTLVAPGTEGRLRIRPALAVGDYLGGPSEGAAAFRRGWFYPGDIGAMNSDGRLRITSLSVSRMSSEGAR